MSTNFTKYIVQFTKNADSEQTHLSFNKGKYNVPDNKFDEFYKKYFETLKENTENLYLIEKVYNSNFAYFLDLDIKNEDLNDDDIIVIIKTIQDIINKMVKNEKCDDYIVSKRDKNYHLNFYNLIVNSQIAKQLTMEIINELDDKYKKCIDMSVYRTGLRLLGSKKNDKDDVYKVYDLNSKTFVDFRNTSFELFLKTTVRRKKNVILSCLKDSYIKQETKETKNIKVKGINNNEIAGELTKLLNHMKLTNEPLNNFDMSVQRIHVSQNKAGFFCYYISINGKYCPFKDREHLRDSSPIYMEVSINGIYLKCYDEECLRRRFPENGFKLPPNFEMEYPNTYLSMTTKYWKPEVEVTDEIKQCLEASLSGSHYQIAKAVFQIYKNRFRVDDVKNTEWYEYNGVRWKRSHLMNIFFYNTRLENRFVRHDKSLA
jgi:hypothetical protein